jgi:hypothetical protein
MRTAPKRNSTRRRAWITVLVTASAALCGWVAGQVQSAVIPLVPSVVASPALGGIAGVVAAMIGGATALAIARRDRRQRERAERKNQWWARARWALDLLVDDDARRRLVGYRVLSSLAGSEWAGVHETSLVESAAQDAVLDFEGADLLDQPDHGG